VREAVRAGLASAGYAPTTEIRDSSSIANDHDINAETNETADTSIATDASPGAPPASRPFDLGPQPQQERIGFGFESAPQRVPVSPRPYRQQINSRAPQLPNSIPSPPTIRRRQPTGLMLRRGPDYRRLI